MATVPDKPTLDGIEATWAQRWADDGTVPLRPHGHPRPGVLHRHPAAHGVAARSTSATSSATPTPTRWPASSACGASSVFYPMGWDDNGLPTERRVQNFFGVRCDPSLPYDPDFEPPETAGQGAVPISRPQLRRAVRAAHRRGRAGVRGRCSAASGCRSTGGTTTRPSTSGPAGTSQRALPAQPGPGRGLPAGGARPSGTSTTARPSPRPRWRTGRSPGAYHLLAFHRADGAATSSSTPPGPSSSASCVALVAHPDDARYQPLFGTTATTPLFGVRGPGRGPPAGRPGEGHRRRHGLHLRRHHRRHLVARARSCRPGPSSAGTAGWPPRCPAWITDRAGRAALRRAGRRDGEAGPGPDRSSCCGRRASCSASPGPSPTR